jgi:phospholipase D1/2
MVIIDQKIALMGGLDLCYGRYDSLNHPINNNSKNMYPGIDYNNIRKKDFF